MNSKTFEDFIVISQILTLVIILTKERDDEENNMKKAVVEVAVVTLVTIWQKRVDEELILVVPHIWNH